MTDTTTETTATTPEPAARGPVPLPPVAARLLIAAGAVGTIASTFLSWTWTPDFPGDLTIYGYPAGLQVIALVAGALTLLYGLTLWNVRGLGPLNPGKATSPVLLIALSAFAVCWFTGIAIAVDLGGLVNLEPGAFVAMAASALPVVGALALPHPAPGTGLRGYLTKPDQPRPGTLSPLAERVAITVGTALALVVFTYGIGINDDDSETFIGFLLVLVFGAWGLVHAGLLDRFATMSARHKGFATTLAFLAAVIFPFTQSDDHNANIGVNILIFATVALGLNIVVGLTGLLDLGYVAFLGVGAYAAALVSGSEYSPYNVHFPFWAAALTGMAASLVFGVLIGGPTLRLRGDYLAIVTLGFGEIFRITVNSLDGTSGPNVTRGPNGITQIPDIKIFGFNLGDAHDVGGFTLGRFANYLFLMLLITAIVVLVFTRAADSRIGRSWIAIREDETAATAMGINGFRVKLIAFALGASLAGLAGTVMAHVNYSVNPQPYQFAGAAPPNSAFLLAAVVLGGMGTVSGPLLGASVLYLVPEKLQFLQNYELFAFGLALILLMRFRPEGIIANRRRQLEFHETGQLDVPEQKTLTDEAAVSKAGA
ncbi:amino acid/amide ABC transporter membrane protein 2 (HAAT family) [Streptomyces puniciscabiei]|uniref:Amino acid/amide ABC transporter membrane protein 2 (HAAT family) n=2 Tax=Streptomyces puniciscabiei TaxID=164348 RepID=A0A542UL51_9ACTN|nr:branched-chain amino acid ABC transporter permease [Streptomyces puniciscabiei]TQK99802.1 amino acid/amide ABC transporter membrane protein 2 (HAAT family) [Streptomyces puniciscabiei]